jgi:anti-sigma regulatory factor (Ser/Thr protein kinase)
LTLRDHEDPRSTVLLTVGGDPTQEARRTIGEVAELRSLPDVRFTAQLLTGELVSNVVRHAGLSSEERFQLDTVCDEHMLRVAVVDGGLGYDPLAVLGDHAALSAGHRGIALIDVLADRWGYRRGPGELEVWFEIDLVPGRRPWIGRERIPQPPPEAG